MTVSRVDRFVRIASDGARSEVDRPVAVEAPVAVDVNGIGYAVMMATPADFDDFGPDSRFPKALSATSQRSSRSTASRWKRAGCFGCGSLPTGWNAS